LVSFLILSELNRFTINSVNHLHSNEGRQVRRDDNNNPWFYWLRSVGFIAPVPIANVDAAGNNSSAHANPSTHLGFRPIL